MVSTLRSLLLGVAVFGFSAPQAFATVSSCTPHNPLPYTIATLQTASSNTPVDGCVSGDIGLSSISMSTSNITGGAATPTSADVTISGDDPASQVTVTGSNISQVDFLFGGSNMWQITGPSQSQTTTIDFTLNVIDGLFSPPESGNVWTMTKLVVDGSFGGGGVGDTGIIKIEFCLGSATFNCANGQTNYGYILVQDVDNTFTRSRCQPNLVTGNCTVHAEIPGPVTVTLSTGYTEIAIQETLTLSTTSASANQINISGGVGIGQTDTVGSVQSGVPEPTTFALFGLGFGALAIRLRRGNTVRS